MKLEDAGAWAHGMLKSGRWVNLGVAVLSGGTPDLNIANPIRCMLDPWDVAIFASRISRLPESRTVHDGIKSLP